MKKAGLTLATILAGCSLQNAPEARHVQPVQTVSAQPAAFSQQPENYALINCDYTLTMEAWGYSIECNQYSTKIRLDHYEWAPESVVYDGECNERLFFEMNDGREKWIDYGCDGNMDAYIHWTRMQREGYDIFAVDEMDVPGQEWKNGFDYLKQAIGAEKADAAWRFRYHVQLRNNGGN